MGKSQLPTLPSCLNSFSSTVRDKIGRRGVGRIFDMPAVESLRLSLYRLEKEFGCAFGIDTSSWRNPEMDEPEGKCKSRMNVGNNLWNIL